MFWERFESLCNESKRKPNRVAAETGISSASITKWKRGTIPNPDSLGKIAEYFCVSIDYLLGKTDQKIDDKTWDEYAEKVAKDATEQYEADRILIKQLFPNVTKEDLPIISDSIVPAIRTIDHAALVKLSDYADDLARLETYRIEKAIEEDQRQKEKSAD